jgi:hypothetical protein
MQHIGGEHQEVFIEELDTKAIVALSPRHEFDNSVHLRPHLPGSIRRLTGETGRVDMDQSDRCEETGQRL